MKIPIIFNLLGRTIQVKRDSRILDAAEAEGLWELESGVIRLYPKNKDRSDEWIGQTFCHELVHALFESCGRNELSKDEVLVDSLGGLLHQVLTTMEFKDE